MFGFEFDFDFEFDLAHFQADTQALAPSAMPGAQKRRISLRLILTNLAVIFILIGSIFLYSGLFGARNAVSAISLVTALLMFIKTDMGIKAKQAPFVIVVLFLFTGIASHCGAWNPFLGLFVNFAAIFLTVVFSCKSVTSKVYLPFVVCYIFSQGNEADGINLVKRMIGLFLGSIVVGIVYYICHRKSPSSRSIASLFVDLHPTSLRTRFAFRLAFALTLGMFIGDLMGLQRTAWIGMTINSLILPYIHQTGQRLPYRVLAQFLGSAIFFFTFQMFLPKEYAIVGLFFTSFIYMFFTSYRVQQIFVSINALAGAMAFTDAHGSIVMRIELVMLGVAISIATNIIAVYVNPMTIAKRTYERIKISRAVRKNPAFPVHTKESGHHENYHYKHKKQDIL